MNTKKVSIIILNLNGKDYLSGCLDSIKKNTLYKNYKVIVMDNGSSDGSQKMVRLKFKWVDLIENKENLGFSRGNNEGIKYAIKKYNPEYFYLLNNDTRVAMGWLTEAVKTGEKEEKIGIVGSKQFSFEGNPTISAGWINFFGVNYYFGSEEKNVNWVSGAGFLIKKGVIKKIGLLDEIYSPTYYEETDFERKAINAGFKVVHCPTSIFYHKGSGTTGGLRNEGYFFIFYRNRIIFFIKNYSILFFIPRMIYDITKSIKAKKLGLLIRAYREGIKVLRKERSSREPKTFKRKSVKDYLWKGY